MIGENNYWVLEYSFSQQTFYAAPLGEIANQNKIYLLEGIQHEFMLIDLFESKEEIEIYVQQISSIVKRKVLYLDIYDTIRVKGNN